MTTDPTHALAGAHTAAAMAFGVLLEAILEQLPTDEATTLGEHVTGKLRMLATDPAQRPVIAGFLEGFQQYAAGVLDLHRRRAG